MNFLKILLIGVGLFCMTMVGCKDHVISEDSTIVFHPEPTIEQIQKNIIFWDLKIQKSPNPTQFNAQLAGAYSQLFDVTGNIEALKKSENLLKEAANNSPLNKAGLLRSLARNYISQHRFHEALELVEKAYEIGSEKEASRFMFFDIYLELGNEDEAISQLESIDNKNSFNYFIRKAKWEDHKGNLDQTIILMNKAKLFAEESKNKGLLNWVYSNLGDYYGHDGQIDKSKEMFKKAIAINPSDWYSVKGLAWIAYSKENDLEVATSLLSQIAKINQTPEIVLLQAEIANIQGNEKLANHLEKRVEKIVSKDSYGVMYNGFLFERELNNNNFTNASKIMEKEMQVRKTPSSFAMLASILEAKGQEDEAKRIIKKEVLPKTFEPSILANQLDLFKNNKEIKKYLIEQTKDARFELGPIEYQKIEKHLEDNQLISLK